MRTFVECPCCGRGQGQEEVALVWLCCECGLEIRREDRDALPRMPEEDGEQLREQG